MGLATPEKIRTLQRKLYVKAKSEPDFRFYLLDRHTSELLRTFLVRRHTVPGRGTRRFRYRYLYEDLGLVRLQDRRRVSCSHALT